MPKQFNDIKEALADVEGLVRAVQIDVMDGEFVPSKSWPFIHGDAIQELPQNTDIFYEIDLMVEHPEVLAGDFIEAGAQRIILHIESLQEPQGQIAAIKEKGAREVVVALNTDTPNETLEDVLEYADGVQFMGIARIGYQGQQFDERVIDKITSFKEMHPDVTISVDGGVSIRTAPLLIEAGASRLAVGSALWQSENIKEALATLQSLYYGTH